MDIKGHFSRNWLNYVLIALGVIIIVAYFKPQLSGYALSQHDMVQWKGLANETDMYRAESGVEPKWTNAGFGGMPTEQISLIYPGNLFKEITNQWAKLFPVPLGSILLHFLMFMLLARLLKINPIIGFLGAIAYSFASYELIILQAGHMTKSMTAAFLPAILGGMIYAYRTSRMWGVIITGIAMAFELAMNHLQVTYYFAFVMIFAGIAFLIDAVRKKELKNFVITTAGLFGVIALAVIINYGNISLTNDYAKYSIRSKNDVTITPTGAPATNQSEGLDKDYITNWSYGIGETFTLLSPYVKGSSSGPIRISPFTEQLTNSDLSPEQMEAASNQSTYWGDQPITSGPVYVGVIICFLAFLGLFYTKDPLNWALLGVTILAIMLSWGKNFMGLTDFFIENIPLYNKFRAVTIILIVVELTIPVMAIIALNELVKNRATILENKKKLFIISGSFVLFLMILAGMGLGDGYAGANEKQQLAGAAENMKAQVMQLTPEQCTQYGFDKNNPAQVQQFLQMQIDQMNQGFIAVKEVRAAIFSSSMKRSIFFSLGLLLVIFAFTYVKDEKTSIGVLTAGSALLVVMDLIPVARNYIGNEDSVDSVMGKPIWIGEGEYKFPIAANTGDYGVLENETAKNKQLAKVVKKYEQEGSAKANELGLIGKDRTNCIDAYRFYGLNMNTNYRVFDLTESPTNSSRASYFHKSIGGYHGAKLQNINNLFAFHLGSMNSDVMNMMNIKYILQKDEQENVRAIPNDSTCGPVWLVKEIETYATPNEEIRALGRQFDLSNKGNGKLVVNGAVVTDAHVYGTEKLQYVVGPQDTISLQMPNGLTEGLDAYMVMDSNGKTNYIPAQMVNSDSTKSFTKLAYMKVTKQFKPKVKAVMLNEMAQKVGAKKFSGEGTIRLLSCKPNRLVYSADVKGDQFAVFSEIYYPNGWTAKIDGKEVDILKVNYLLRGLKLSSGKHKIVFEYDLPKYYKANTYARIASIGMLLLLAGGLFWEFRKRRTSNAAKA